MRMKQKLKRRDGGQEREKTGGKLLYASVYIYLRVRVTRDGQGGKQEGQAQKTARSDDLH